MLPRVAALCLAASIIVWPAGAGSDTDTFWSTPSAAVLAAMPAPALDPAQQQVADAAEAVPPEQAIGEDNAPMHETPRTDVPARTAAGDAAETKIPPPPTLPPALRPAPMQPELGLTAKSDGKGDAQGGSNRRPDGAAQTATLEPAQPKTSSPPPVSEPFGLVATPVSFGEVLTKWHGVESRIHADNEVFARCAQSEQRCPQGARNFLAIVAQGRAQTGRVRIGIINRAVNLAIEPMSDMAQWGVPDRWSPPLETFTTGRGDCEDYAIAKYVALTAAGIPAQDVKLIIVRNIAANEDHAVTAVRDGDDWIILDNRWLTLVKDVAMPKIIPEFVLDGAGVREFVPPAIAVAQRGPAPASARF